MQSPSKIMYSSLEGIINGIQIGIDPLGAGFSHYSNIKTFGGGGLKGLTNSSKREPNVDYDSKVYKVGKIFGTGFGLWGQIHFYGIPQGAVMGLNFITYVYWKNHNTEKFETPSEY